jgi:hypothetical protein
MWHVWKRVEMCKMFWLGELNKKPLGKPRREWKGNIKTHVKEERWEEMYLIRLVQNRVSAGLREQVIKVLFPQNARNFLTG